MYQNDINQHTARNLRRSRPDAMSLKTAKVRFISNLRERAMFTTVSSGMLTSGMRGGDLTGKHDLLKTEANGE